MGNASRSNHRTTADNRAPRITCVAVTEAFDQSIFDQAVSELRLGDAERLMHRADPSRREDLEGVIREARTRAREAAEELYRVITDLGTANDHAGVLARYRRPETDALLGFLSESHRGRVDVYVGVARRWEASQGKVNERRLADARRALDDFDLQLARGLLARLEEEFLDEERRTERDRLMLDIEARAMELESFDEAAQRFSDRSEGERVPWWRRWRR